jgi:enoyl-CoA hydratase/carnithine racemase
MRNIDAAQSRPVLEITPNRPEKKSALTRATYDGIVEAFRRGDAARDVRVTLITGAGNKFSL